MAKRKPQNLMSPHANESMGLHKLSWWQHTKCKQIRQMYLYKLWIRTDMQYISIYVMYNKEGVFKVFPRTADPEQQWGNSNISTPKTCLKVRRDLQHVRQQFAGIVWKGAVQKGGGGDAQGRGSPKTWPRQSLQNCLKRDSGLDNNYSDQKTRKPGTTTLFNAFLIRCSPSRVRCILK